MRQRLGEKQSERQILRQNVRHLESRELANAPTSMPPYQPLTVVYSRLLNVQRRIQSLSEPGGEGIDPRLMDNSHLSSATVFALRDHAFKIEILQRMIFRRTCKAPCARFIWDALRHGRRLQEVVHLETEIVMQMASGMFLNHESSAAPLSAPSRISNGVFGCYGEIAFTTVFAQSLPCASARRFCSSITRARSAGRTASNPRDLTICLR